MSINLPILFVTGLPCSGKSEFINIAKSLPLLCVEWSQFFKDIFNNCSQLKERKELLRLIEQMVLERGIDYFPKQIVLCIDNLLNNSLTKYKGVVISGARNPDELRILAKAFSKSCVVIICADYNIRFHRVKQRMRAKDPQDLKQFIWNDFAELHSGLAQIADEIADELIFNDGDYNEFARQASSILEQYFQIQGVI